LEKEAVSGRKQKKGGGRGVKGDINQIDVRIHKNIAKTRLKKKNNHKSEFPTLLETNSENRRNDGKIKQGCFNRIGDKTHGERKAVKQEGSRPEKRSLP